MSLVVKEQDSTSLSSIRHYCLSLKDMAWKHLVNHINNSDPGHTLLKQQLEKNLNKTFVSLSKKGNEKEKRTNRKEIAKCFVFHGNAIILFARIKKVTRRKNRRHREAIAKRFEWYANTIKNIKSIFVKKKWNNSRKVCTHHDDSSKSLKFFDLYSCFKKIKQGKKLFHYSCL